MSTNALQLLLEQAEQREHNAAVALHQARLSLENYYQQLAQIEQYRLEYSRQMAERGQQGLTASSYGHLHKFLNQLDETLSQQRQAEWHFKQAVEEKTQAWQQARQDKKSYQWMLDKKAQEKRIREEKQQQKMLDELATIQFARRMQGRD
ncbi:hypothetical protein VST7929_02010 [Vibrio stylophorae]|uniref:Flagellar FliJ protein n=1 Tax=Vibrio stylophorae TaxID=659351 RepID=A0ABN8DUZ4_9VIBR|nr:flagellar export protein FliJ [Vibrio stylophorae]CAH0534109.1 hypothetical protein VST7929_02010 [Vibrio stylophorae]